MTIDYIVIITSILTFGAPIMFQYLNKMLSPYKCIVVTNDHDKQALQSNLLSDRYIIVDLDTEIRKTLTEAQKAEKPLTVGSEVINVLPNCYYERASSVLDNLTNVIKNKEIVLMSYDYMLLKSLGKRTSITYTIPSSSHLKSIPGNGGFSDTTTYAINGIKTNKPKRLQVYNNVESLENIVIRVFNEEFSRKF
jgi:hypothetical protein